MNFLNEEAPAEPEQETETIKTSNPMKKVLVTLGLVVVLGASGAAAYYYKQYDDLKKNPNKVSQDQTSATIAAIGKLIQLPEGEQPTVATVTDPAKLKDQSFFAHASVGDKVLVYTQAKKAILYNPGSNKIVEVAPVNIGDSSQVSGTDTTTPDSTTK
jgi:hypothetical protein